MAVGAVTRFSLHEKFIENMELSVEGRKNCVIDYLKDVFHTNGNEVATKALVVFTRTHFFAPYIRNWKSVKRSNERFIQTFGKWLDEEIKFPDIVLRCVPTPISSEPSTSSTGYGRPSKQFKDCSDVVKRRKTKKLRTTKSADEMTYATIMKLREEGDEAAAKLLKESVTITPSTSRAKRILRKWKTVDPNQSAYTSEEALSLVISLNLTKHQYLTLRRSASLHGHTNLYPSYHSVLDMKKQLYPEGIISTEKTCEVPLQTLLNKTCESVLKTIPSESNPDRFLNLICKWGFDGSSGYTTYKQISNTSEEISAEESAFVTSLVPLRLVDENSSNVFWKNPNPASKRFCRPIRLQWIHETQEISQSEEDYINQQINNLLPFDSEFGRIKFTLSLTMVDGKVCSALASTSSMRCYICNATISHFNDIEHIRSRPIEPQMLRFGLSVLHAYIRFFECLLHIAYRLELKVWKVSKESKDLLKNKKRELQNKFRQRMGLVVDVPKAGAGTTNDGNTARRFFADPKLSSEITGIDEDLIKRFSVVLKTINSSHEINTDKFDNYCVETAHKYVSLYGWYYMPTSVHKVLLHGAVVIEHAVLPIGELSEEAQEAKNKDLRRYREHHTRKISALKINEDVFHRLILSSDPKLSSFLQGKQKQKITDVDVLQLIKISEEDKYDSDEDDVDEDDDL